MGAPPVGEGRTPLPYHNRTMLLADNPFGLSDTVLLAIVGILAMIVKELFDRQRAKEAASKVATVAADARQAAHTVAAKANEVKQALQESTTATDEKLAGLQKTGDANHILLNGNMGVQLRLAATALRTVAELRKHPEDVKAAQLAEDAFRDHEKKQHAVAAPGGAATVEVADPTGKLVIKVDGVNVVTPKDIHPKDLEN